MRNSIVKSVNEAVAASNKLIEDKALDFIFDVSLLLINTYRNHGKVLVAGNGGSLCDAMHFAEELTGFFRKQREPLGAIAFADPSHMSCVSNDLGFDQVFSRLVQAYGLTNDVFVVMSTSGNSKNLIEAVEKAKTLNLKTVAFLGKDGGQLKGVCDYEWVVDGFQYSDRIQEAHMAAIHIIIEMIEKELFYSGNPDVSAAKETPLCSQK